MKGIMKEFVLLVFRLHRREWLFSLANPAKPSLTAVQTQSLLKLNIARSSMDIQQHAAISNLALDMVVGQCALRCDLVVIEPQRS